MFVMIFQTILQIKLEKCACIYINNSVLRSTALVMAPVRASMNILPLLFPTKTSLTTSKF